MAADPDDDNDGIADTADGYPLVSIGSFTDTDGDGRPNDCDSACVALGMAADTDDDNDGVADTVDGYPLISIGSLTDTDGDGRPNGCDSACVALGMTADPDDDNDGIFDESDLFPLDGNDWADFDLDGIGDNTDADDDNDGVDDAQDQFPYDARGATDLDFDGMPDEWELKVGLDPESARDAFFDPDQDGLLNWEEWLLGTDPLRAEYASQIVTLDEARTLSPGVPSRLTFNYAVSDDNYDLNGLGLRIHFNSSLIAAISIENPLSKGLVGAVNAGEPDLLDFDNDSDTDRFISVSWALVNGKWPGGNNPITLFDMLVTPSEAALAAGEVILRMTGADVSEGYNLSGQSVYLPVRRATLDIDGDGEARALTDGLLILRHLFGFDGKTLVSGAVSAEATIVGSDAIKTRLQTIESILDIDDDTEILPLTDGLLILRYLFGFNGQSLISGAVSEQGSRQDADSIEAYLDSLMPVTN